MKEARSARTGNCGLKPFPLPSVWSSYTNVKTKQEQGVQDIRVLFWQICDPLLLKPATPLSPLQKIRVVPIIPSCKVWKPRKSWSQNISHFSVLPTLPLCISGCNISFIHNVGNGQNFWRSKGATVLGHYCCVVFIINCIERSRFRGSAYHWTHREKDLDIQHPGKEIHDCEVRPKTIRLTAHLTRIISTAIRFIECIKNIAEWSACVVLK